jgi:hypothetical protein
MARLAANQNDRTDLPVHRVARLEKQIRVDFEELPPVLQDLKRQVDNFRNKLETTEHLSWLGE